MKKPEDKQGEDLGAEGEYGGTCNEDQMMRDNQEEKKMDRRMRWNKHSEMKKT